MHNQTRLNRILCSPFLIVVIALAIIFDLINGFHDAANSIATVVSTKVLTPFQAVLWAAFFNVLAYFIFHLNVADTVAKTVKTGGVTLEVIFAGLVAAIFLEPAYLVVWYSFQFIAYTHWWICRGSRSSCWYFCHHLPGEDL